MTAKLNRENAPHSQPCSMVRFTGQCLLLLFIGALPALLTTTPAKAGACDNQTVSTSVRDQQLSTAVVINEVPANPYGERHEGSVCWSLDSDQGRRTTGQDSLCMPMSTFRTLP